MRVAHVIAEMGAGGAEALVEDLSRYALARGDAVTVVSAGGRRAESLAREGARLVSLALHRRSPVRALAGAAGAAPRLRRRYDLVHAHNVGATLVAHLATRWPGRRPPLVATVHGLPAGDYAKAARVLRLADLVVACSETERAALASAGVDSVVIDNGVTALPAPSRAAARRALGLGDDVPVVVWVARLATPKRPDLLARAWESVPAPAELLVAGSGPLAISGPRITSLGDRSDVGTLLAAADAYVLASDSEGMPMAVLEAMAAGVPVVATDVGGLASCGDAAELVPPGDATALGAALRRVLTDPGERARLSAAGRALVAARFSAAAMREKYDAVYADLLARSVR